MSSEDKITFQESFDHRHISSWMVFRGEMYVGDLKFDYVMDLIFIPSEGNHRLHIHHLAQIIKFMAEQEEKTLQANQPDDKINHENTP